MSWGSDNFDPDQHSLDEFQAFQVYPIISDSDRVKPWEGDQGPHDGRRANRADGVVVQVKPLQAREGLQRRREGRRAFGSDPVVP